MRGMIAAFDVHYVEDKYAMAAAVLFQTYSDAEAAREYLSRIYGVLPYVSGQFYRRELPCILQLLEQFNETPDEIVIDGYVMLGDRPGLGWHLFESLAGRFPLSVWQNRNTKAHRESRSYGEAAHRPLYVTSAGVDPSVASDRIRAMHGAHRVPTLLRRVDVLARQEVHSSVL